MKYNKRPAKTAFSSFEMALRNIIHFGDTDIFPFPFERQIFEDRFEDCKSYLVDIHKNFTSEIISNPPLTSSKLVQVGYFGFRSATQIEPFWNAYYLSQVISIAEKIESARLPVSENNVFSYRFEWNSEKSSLFKDLTWNDYKKQCLSNSHKYRYVIQTDISDFYGRVNHHKLANELKRLGEGSDASKRILELLSSFSNTSSYGLPVGGPASRILAELALNHTDRHLKGRGIEFCRYADDFTLFANSEATAYKYLVLLAEKLLNEGLTLQKNKTRIFQSKEYVSMHTLLDPLEPTNPIADEQQKLLSISIRFDPYSATAEEDYRTLKNAVRTIDIIGILSKEVSKTRIDQNVTKQAINAIKVLEKKLQNHAVRILLDFENLVTLAPVFPSIIRAVRGIYNELETQTRQLVDRSLLNLFALDLHLLKIELNINYIVQVLALNKTPEKETLLIQLFDTTNDPLLKRQIILTMGKWKCHYWLADLRTRFSTLSMWEKRAFICASYSLGDEGSHWRKHRKNGFNSAEVIVRDWSAEKWDVDSYSIV